MPGFWDQAARTLPGAYQQSSANYLRQKQMEQQRQWELEDQKRKEKLNRMKEMAAAATERRKQHKKFMDAARAEHQRSIGMEGAMKYTNERLAPYLKRGDISTEDVDWFTAHIGRLQKPSQVAPYIDRRLDLLDREREGWGRQSASELFNESIDLWKRGLYEQMTPSHYKAIEVHYDKKGIVTPDLPAKLKVQNVADMTNAEFMGAIRTRIEFEKKQEKFDKEREKFAKTAQSKMEIARAKYDEDVALATAEVPDVKAYGRVSGGGIDLDPSKIVSFEEWLVSGDRPRKYKEAAQQIQSPQIPFGYQPQGQQPQDPGSQPASAADLLLLKQVEEQVRQVEEQIKRLEGNMP